jgi:hypothetical protein
MSLCSNSYRGGITMKRDIFTYQGVDLDVTFAKSETVRHGGPFDRGSADSYYHRGEQPHYYVGDTHNSERVEQSEMNEQELLEYHAGFEYNETINMDWKDWG